MADITETQYIVNLSYAGGRQCAIMPLTGFSPIVKYKMWGAGGGAGGWDSPGQGGDGGGGGFVEGIVTIQPGQLIEVYNGQGGWPGGTGRGSSISSNTGVGGSSLKWVSNDTDPTLLNSNLSTYASGVTSSGSGPAFGFGSVQQPAMGMVIPFNGVAPLLKNFLPDNSSPPTHDIVFRLPGVTQSHITAFGIETPFSQIPLVKDVMTINWSLSCNAGGKVNVGVFVWRRGVINRNAYQQLAAYDYAGGNRVAVNLSGSWRVPSGLDPKCIIVFAVGDLHNTSPTGMDNVNFTANAVIPSNATISDYSGGRGGYPGWSGSSGQGGGGGGATVLKIDNAVVAVAGGGGGGGGGGHVGAVHGESSVGIISPTRDFTVQPYNLTTGAHGYDKAGDGAGGGGGGGGAEGGIGGSYPGGDQGAYAGAAGTNRVPGQAYNTSGIYSAGMVPGGVTDTAYPGNNVGYGGYRIPMDTSPGGNGFTQLTFYRSGDFYNKIEGEYKPMRASIYVNGAWSTRTAQWVKISGEWKNVNGSEPVTFTTDSVNWGGNGFHYAAPVTEPAPVYDYGGGDAGGFSGDTGGGGGGGCFTASTLITMYDGSTKTIDSIVAGDLVLDALTGNPNRVLGVKTTDYPAGEKLFTTVKGVNPFITEEHAFYNDNNELCAISEKCYSLAPWLGDINIVKVHKIVETKEQQTVYNLMLESGNSHYANGVRVNNMIGTGNTYVLYLKGYIDKNTYLNYTTNIYSNLTAEQKTRVFQIVEQLSAYILNNNNLQSRMLAKSMAWALKNKDLLYPYVEKWFKSRLRNWIFAKRVNQYENKVQR